MTSIERLQDIATLMYKVKNGLTSSSPAEFFRFKNEAHNLRNSDFEIPRFETTSDGKHSIRYLGPYIWAKLSKIDKVS